MNKDSTMLSLESILKKETDRIYSKKQDFKNYFCEVEEGVIKSVEVRIKSEKVKNFEETKKVFEALGYKFKRLDQTFLSFEISYEELKEVHHK